MEKLQPLTIKLLDMTDAPYENYNANLAEIKKRLEVYGGVHARRLFEQVLAEELPFTTVRRAYRTAIKMAMGETVAEREYRKQEIKSGPKK